MNTAGGRSPPVQDLIRSGYKMVLTSAVPRVRGNRRRGNGRHTHTLQHRRPPSSDRLGSERCSDHVLSVCTQFSCQRHQADSMHDIAPTMMMSAPQEREGRAPERAVAHTSAAARQRRRKARLIKSLYSVTVESEFPSSQR